MRTDIYTKDILSVIAVCLMIIAFRGQTTVAHAQNEPPPMHVIIDSATRLHSSLRGHLRSTRNSTTASKFVATVGDRADKMDWKRFSVTITPSQCRGARGMLGWTQGQLVRASGVAKPMLAAFEAGGPLPQPQIRELRVALETTGISFLNDADGEGYGVRLKTHHGDDEPRPSGPATDIVKRMDAAIEEHKSSKRKR